MLKGCILTTLILVVLAVAASVEDFNDPFLPTLPLGAEPDTVRDTMEEYGWEIDTYGVDPDGWTSIYAGNSSGWLLYYEYTPEGDPFSIVLAEVWPEDGQRADSHADWNESLRAQFGDPRAVESAYGDLLHWPGDLFTVELDLNVPEFYIEGYFTLVVLVLFETET